MEPVVKILSKRALYPEFSRCRPWLRWATGMVFGVLLLVIAGCGTARENHEAKARETLSLLPGLAGAVREVPPLNEQSGDALKALSDFSLKSQKSNALLIHLEELENPTVRLALPVRLNHRSPSVDVATELKLIQPVATGTTDTRYDPACGPDSPDWQLMAEARYVLIVRTTNNKAAELTGGNTFQIGEWQGEILAFELGTKKFLGGFKVAGSNHQSVQTRLGRDQANLNADLQLAVRGNLNVALRKYFPSVGPADEIN